eukprot:GEMP01037499.1.p1 GENE.GEMP01037499.1~~GEMP01037499.1.p1  ORF type:complete len:341 (+),score=24.02 GEMP01037499.1:453-1475(+)
MEYSRKGCADVEEVIVKDRLLHAINAFDPVAVRKAFQAFLRSEVKCANKKKITTGGNIYHPKLAMWNKISNQIKKLLNINGGKSILDQAIEDTEKTIKAIESANSAFTFYDASVRLQPFLPFKKVYTTMREKCGNSATPFVALETIIVVAEFLAGLPERCEPKAGPKSVPAGNILTYISSYCDKSPRESDDVNRSVERLKDALDGFTESRTFVSASKFRMIVESLARQNDADFVKFQHEMATHLSISIFNLAVKFVSDIKESISSKNSENFGKDMEQVDKHKFQDFVVKFAVIYPKITMGLDEDGDAIPLPKRNKDLAPLQKNLFPALQAMLDIRFVCSK